MEIDNTNQPQQVISNSPQSETNRNPLLNQKGIFTLILGIIFLITVLGVYYFEIKSKQTAQDKVNTNIQPSPISTLSTTPSQVMSKTPYLATFMRKGEIWIKNFLSNQEYKVSKTSKVEGPVFSPNGKYLYYFEIVHAGDGFPRYSIFITDVNGYSEKTFNMGANHFASKVKWSDDSNYLGMVLFGNDIPGGVNYSEEAFIYDTSTQKEISIGKVKRSDLSNDQYDVEDSCSQLPSQYVSFCNQYLTYLQTPRSNDYKGGYKSEEYTKSKYTKPNYKLSRSEKLENGLVVLEYYAGEPQNPESKWGIGGGVFVPGYDAGVTETYTILLDEQEDKVLQEIPMAIDSDFIFDTTGNWKTYTNKKYSYQVKYPPDKSYEEPSASGYGYTDFLLGCFRVFVVPPSFDNKDLQQKTGVPWAKLNELESTPVGSTKSYPIDEWKMGDDKTFTLKYDYKKLQAKQIGGINWNAFEGTNNWENHAIHNIYFTNKNSNVYLINMMSYGPCYEDEPVQMLSTFKFLN